MKDEEQQQINNNLDSLVARTDCTTRFLSKLLQKSHLSNEDCDELVKLKANKNKYEANFKFYQIIKTRKDAYTDLVSALEETSQTDAADILNSVDNRPSGSIPVWFDVQDSVPTFVGRDEELAELDKALNIPFDDPKKSQIIICGMGGVGKTELCRHYLTKLKAANYDAVWINAESEASVGDSFQRLAESLGMHSSSTKGGKKTEKELHKVIKKVFRRLQKKSNCIIVYDNCENEEILRKNRLLPTNIKTCNHSNAPKIIITSQHNKFMPGVKVIKLKELKLADAVALINKGLNPDYNLFKEECATTLASLLQCYPLAIQQAVAYINNTNEIDGNYSVERYIEEFSKYSLEFLDDKEFLSNTDYSKTTYTTWKLTLDKLRKEGHLLAIQVLKTISYLDSTITSDLLKPLGGKDDGLLRMRDAFKQLVNYSLLTYNRQQDVFSIHRLVQQVITLYNKNEGVHKEEIMRACEIVNSCAATTKSTLHANSVWFHASNYTDIIDIFYDQSKYTNKVLTPLHLLAENGSLEAVENLLKHFSRFGRLYLDFRINCRDDYNRTPLFLAASKGDCKTVQILLQNGAEINICSNICYSSLNRLKIKAFDPTQWNPIHIAVYHEYCNVVQLLASDDESLVDVKDSRGNTPAILAARLGHVQIVQYLKPKDEVYHICALIGETSYNKEALNKLRRELDTLPNVTNVLNSALQGHKLKPLDFAAKNGSPEVINLLLTNGAIPFENDDDYFQCLIKAAEQNHLEYFKMLVNNHNGEIHLWPGGDPSASKNQWTLLHRAAKCGSKDILKYIFENFPNQFNWECTDDNGDTPFYHAAYEGHLTTVKYLISIRCNINAINRIGCSPILAAAIHNEWDVVKYLLSLNCEQNCWVDIKEYDPKQETYMGRLGLTILHAAISYDDVEMVKYLVEEKKLFSHLTKEPIRKESISNITPLQMAALFDSSKVADLMASSNYMLDFNDKLNILSIVNVFYDSAAKKSIKMTDSGCALKSYAAYCGWYLFYLVNGFD